MSFVVGRRVVSGAGVFALALSWLVSIRLAFNNANSLLEPKGVV